MASGGRIPDDSFSASSIFNARYAAKYGRLNGRGAWEPKTNTDPDDYLQIDLLYEYVICAVATQGNPPTQSPDAQEWTTEYKLRFSFSGNTFSPYEEIKTDKVGNRSFCTKDFSHKSFSTSFRPFAQFLVVISHNNHK